MKKYAFSAIFIIGTHFESIFERFLGVQKEKWGAKKPGAKHQTCMVNITTDYLP